VEIGWSNSQEWTNVAESSKEGCGSKMAVLPMMMMMRMMIYSPYFVKSNF
jgi:hypothetical protein